MSIAVIYWSGTGNTEAMAQAVEEGAKSAGAETILLPSAAFDASMPELSGKTIALFGSYGWGDGEWMRQWEDTCTNAGAKLACDSVICCGYPDEEAVDGCKKLGAALAHE